MPDPGYSLLFPATVCAELHFVLVEDDLHSGRNGICLSTEDFDAHVKTDLDNFSIDISFLVFYFFRYKIPLLMVN